MRLHFQGENPATKVTAYGAGFFDVNEQRYESNLVLYPERVLAPWSVPSLLDFSMDDFAELMVEKPEIVLVGTGNRQIFPNDGIVQQLHAMGIGFEFMDSAAACRTFNVLASEGRSVCAGVLLLTTKQ